MTKIAKCKLKITGMHCSSCAMNIDFDLEDLDGVESAKTSYARQESVVEFDQERVTFDDLLRSVKKTGYIAKIEE